MNSEIDLSLITSDQEPDLYREQVQQTFAQVFAAKNDLNLAAGKKSNQPLFILMLSSGAYLLLLKRFQLLIFQSQYQVLIVPESLF